MSPSPAAVTPAAKEVMPSQHLLQNKPDKLPFQNTSVQFKLAIGGSDDPLEREADAMADTIMRMPEQNFIQRKCNDCPGQEEELQRKPLISFIQRKELSSGSVAPDVVSKKIHENAGNGSNLDANTQTFMQSRFGADFNNVKIHTGTEATQMNRQLNAKAFTAGNDIYFNEGQYDTSSNQGKHLLAHELTHTIQQQDQTINKKIQKSDPDIVPTQDQQGGTDVTAGLSAAPVSPGAALVPDEGNFTQSMPDLNQRVVRIVVSCHNMLLRLDTATASHVYHMDSCAVPEGSYETNVVVTGRHFNLTPQVPNQPPGGFHFRYHVRAEQANPASLLRGQQTVHVDVVPDIVVPPRTSRRDRTRSGCLLSLPDQELVPAESASRSLFDPLRFDRTIWRHPVPLGNFGWVDLNANASGQLTGNINGSYGPGMLRNICMTYEQDRVHATAPIDNPLLGSGSQTDVTTTTLHGFAEFNMPARAAIRLMASGLLRISGDYLSVISLAAAEGRLTALGEGTLSGSINGRVEISTTVTQAAATLVDDDIVPLSLDIGYTTLTPVDLTAEIGLQGRAGLLFRVDLSAGFELLGNNLWSQSWNLVNYNPFISWAGGLRYRPGSGVEWNLGSTGRNSTITQPGAMSAFHTDHADVDEEDIIDSIIDEHRAVVSAPDGLSERTALPFIWYKPIDLYPRVMDIPSADDPTQVMRDQGPVHVRYTDGTRSIYEMIGVADWPARRRRFQFMPYDLRSEPEKDRFARLVDRLGYHRSGVDIDHVWDIGLRGLDYDRFDNLWPASNQDQQLAGGRHNRQIVAYRSTIGNINGRWFIIVDVRDPA